MEKKPKTTKTDEEVEMKKSQVKTAIPQTQQSGNRKHDMCIIKIINAINCKPV